jgi:hypothetical protein
MKIRWREHEIIFVTILMVAQVIEQLTYFYSHTTEQLQANIAGQFIYQGFSFIYWKNALIPRISIVVLLYIGYLAINLLILRPIKKISFDDVEKILSVNIIKAIIAILVTSYLLAIGVNIISYYARPHLINYDGYQLLALFGYNDKPLTNLFSGFDRAIYLVLAFTALAGIRELIIHVISRPAAKREYRVMITNNITPLVFIYFLVLIFINPLHETFLLYVGMATPIIFLYIYTTFWLFPLKGEQSFLQRPVLLRLSVATFIGSLLFIIFPINARPLAFISYWIFLLVIITPLCWILYQQRKDKIVQLRGLETALARSSADLQFLRSQINPHFLFNALNTLYGTALKEGSTHTAEGIQKLGDMMRFMLHENNQDAIPMANEIKYLENYIALQKLRTQSSPDIIIEDNIEGTTCHHNIAPMLLIPFVENAFKHGISLNEQSFIHINLTCTESNICFEVRNSVHDRPVNDPEQNRSGIGLKNVKERLQLIYPHKHEITITNNNHEFLVRLIISNNRIK